MGQLGGSVSSAIKKATELIDGILELPKDILDDLILSLRELLSSLKGAIDAIKELIEELGDLADDLVQELQEMMDHLTGIMKKMDKVTRKVLEVANDADEATRKEIVEKAQELAGKTNKLLKPIISEWDEFEKKLDKMKK
ncbi:MAG: hypothetical protein OEW78_09065 [Nitrosopumilus sp.]|uniref:hypothetical protein n=1 Tax=Nitrosopumilus sp. TaxID=2024843 RepID=UPI0024722582|nr:hypothetical protein [Nitrosopumilus sp.]MDH5432012.1 hypothetical protein [Nitrosopumilus sp.]